MDGVNQMTTEAQEPEPKKRKPKRPLSEKPASVRRRLRKSGANVNRDIEMLYHKPVAEWDMEELARGRPRGENGKFQGPRPKWVSPLILKQAQDRLRALTREEMSVYAGDAVRVMATLMKDESTDEAGKAVVSPAVRLSAATYVMDQIIGKPTNHVEVTGNVVLESLMAKVLVNDESGTAAHPVLDAEVVEDEDDPDEEDGDE